MSLRWKIALAMAAIAVASTIAIGAVSYRSTRQQLLAEVDRSLVDVDRMIAVGQFGREPLPERGPLSGLDARVVDVQGNVLESTFEVDFPLDDAMEATLGRRAATSIETVETDDGDYRIRTVGFQRGAIQVGRSLAETDRVLAGLRVRIILSSDRSPQHSGGGCRAPRPARSAGSPQLRSRSNGPVASMSTSGPSRLPTTRPDG